MALGADAYAIAASAPGCDPPVIFPVHRYSVPDMLPEILVSLGTFADEFFVLQFFADDV